MFRHTGVLFPALLAGTTLAAVVLWLAFPLPPPKPYSLLVEDRHGRFLHAFRATDGAWRLKTTPEEIPADLKRILLEKEDRWFFFHPGVNPVSLVRAAMQNLAAGRTVSGASTITMQLARMLEPKERTIPNKLGEMFRALQLEWRYTKNELLEMYLSTIPLGGNIEGLNSAALLYYQTPLERLNIAQLLDLILIPNNPNGLRPDREGDRLYGERLKRARRWLADGFLPVSDSLTIWNTRASAVREPLPRFAQHCALRILRQAPSAAVYRSTLDLDMQKQVETLLSNHLRPWKLAGVQNGAVLVLENATGAVRVYVGSESFDDASARGQVDAVTAVRSPGSTLKPFLYAMQMDRGELTPRTVLLDVPYDAEGFLAENYDGTYDGTVFADEALQRSLNVPMVRMLKAAGLPAFLDFLDQEGMTTLRLQRPRLGLSVILGGCGVTLEELTTAFATFPRAGLWRPARLDETAVPDTGKGRRVFSRGSAYLVTQILSGLQRPDLPNNFDYAMHLPRVAYKTGTSYGRRDAWCIGYTADYTVGVWIGNVTNRGNPELVGSRSAAPLLLDVFTSISSAQRKEILPEPPEILRRQVCVRSGLPPGPWCERTIDDLYVERQTATTRCPVCTEFLVSPDGSMSYCSTCLGTKEYRTVVYARSAPELLHFWRLRDAPRGIAPPHNPACTRVFAGDGPSILSPTDNMTYYLVDRAQNFVLQAGSGIDVREHRWYIDDAYLGVRRPGEKLFVPLSAGTHTVACMDDRGRMSRVSIVVQSAMN